MSSLVALFFTAAVLKLAVINVVGGFLFGAGIGFVPIYTTFVDTSSNCSMYTSEPACLSLPSTSCNWTNATAEGGGVRGKCTFQGTDCRSLFGNSSSLCAADDHHGGDCIFDHDEKMCKNSVGFDALKKGVFAGAMIVGVMFGCFTGGDVVRRLGTKSTITAMGCLGLVGSAMVHAAARWDVYALLVAGRVVYGVACGLGCVCCPMHIDIHAPEELRTQVGSLFQISITLAIAMTAGYGLALNPTDLSTDAHMLTRLQAFVSFNTLLSFFTLLLGVLMSNPPPVGGDESAQSPGLRLLNSTTSHTTSNADEFEKGRVFTLYEMRGPIFGGILMACAAQMTGINAIMNYAPNITKSMDLQPLTGNFLIMAWNFVTTLAAIPIAAYTSMTRMFLMGTLVVSLSCLCTGIPVYPGVTSPDIKHPLATIGVGTVIAAFEIGMGPAFWILVQEIFPISFRPRGASITTVALQIFNIIINVFFPIAVQGLSGGAGGNQDKGMAIVFVVFGTIGLVCWVVLLKVLKPYRAAV